jgi:ferredoxin
MDVAVELSVCVRCGACASVAPAVFRLSRKGIEVTEPRVTETSTAVVRAAQLVCPTQAIRAVRS